MTSTTGLRETLVEDGVLRSIAADPRGWHLTTRELASIASELLERRTPSPNGSGEQVSEASAVEWIGIVRDELAAAGYPAGDRDVALASIRRILSASMAGPVPEGWATVPRDDDKRDTCGHRGWCP